MIPLLHDEEALIKYEDLKSKGLILFEGIVGSQAYGTALPTSDIDKKFVYIETLECVLANTHTEQLNVNKDYVGYELSRFIELLTTGNPNIQDLIALPEDCIISCHPLFKKYLIDNKELFLTQNVRNSYGKYAQSQISKARGLNKKIMQEIPKERKGLLDFTWTVLEDGRVVLIQDYLKENNLTPNVCGLASINHIKNCYNLYIDEEFYQEKIDLIREQVWSTLPFRKQLYRSRKRIDSWGEEAKLEYKTLLEVQLEFTYRGKFKGIVDKDNVQPVLTSIPKGMIPLCQIYMNLEGFSKYCKEYREYWDWVENRNETRYQDNQKNGCQYDSKNMAHCHRLLDMCYEILTTKQINVRRKNREQLLEIRSGKYEYETLLAEANEKIELINSCHSDLPEEVDKKMLDDLLLSFRKEIYKL